MEYWYCVVQPSLLSGLLFWISFIIQEQWNRCVWGFVSEKFAWPNPLQMSEEILKATNGDLLSEDGVFTVSFHERWWIDYTGRTAKTLQKGKIKSRKVKHHMKRESLWWYLNFSKNIPKKKKRVLLEVQLSEYCNCNELYITYTRPAKSWINSCAEV